MGSSSPRFHCNSVPQVTHCPQSPNCFPNLAIPPANNGNKCDCCCVPGIKEALENLKGANAIIVIDSPFFNSLIAGNVISVTSNTILMGPPIGTVSTPITGSTPGTIAKATTISLCAITFVAAG